MTTASLPGRLVVHAGTPPCRGRRSCRRRSRPPRASTSARTCRCFITTAGRRACSFRCRFWETCAGFTATTTSVQIYKFCDEHGLKSQRPHSRRREPDGPPDAAGRQRAGHLPQHARTGHRLDLPLRERTARHHAQVRHVRRPPDGPRPHLVRVVRGLRLGAAVPGYPPLRQLGARQRHQHAGAHLLQVLAPRAQPHAASTTPASATSSRTGSTSAASPITRPGCAC